MEEALGRVEDPQYLRGMTLLALSSPEGEHQAFVYLPSMGRVGSNSSVMPR